MVARRTPLIEPALESDERPALPGALRVVTSIAVTLAAFLFMYAIAEMFYGKRASSGFFLLVADMVLFAALIGIRTLRRWGLRMFGLYFVFSLMVLSVFAVRGQLTKLVLVFAVAAPLLVLVVAWRHRDIFR